MNKKVTIIIPVYNVESFVHRAIESSINQTYDNLEIIIIDDGSSDNTLKICESYSKIDKRVYCYHKNNGGVSSARNMGLEHMSGDYVIFLDSDDWLESNAVETLLNESIENVDVLVMCDRFWTKFDSNNKIKKIYPGKGKSKETMAAQEALLDVGRGKFNLQSACYKLFDSKIIEKYSLTFDETLHFGEDGLFVFSYLKRVDSIVYTPLPLWDILEREGSATKSDFNEKMMTTPNSVKKMLEFNDNSSELICVLKIYMIQRLETVLNCVIQTDYKKHFREIKLLRREISFYYNELDTDCFSVLEKYKVYKYTMLPLNVVYILNKIEFFLKNEIKNIVLIIKNMNKKLA